MYARGLAPRPEPGTLTRIFFDSIRTYDKPDAMMSRQDATWHPISHRTILERVRRMALGLGTLGVSRGDRVAILSENRPEWALADWACVTSGLPDVPLYATLPAEQLPYLLNDSGSIALFVSTAAQAEKVATIRAQVPGLKHVIAFDESARPFADWSLRELEARGAALDTPDRGRQFEAESLGARPEDLVTIIYTSGTTGAPKGVMLTHDNLHSNVRGSRNLVTIGADDVGLSFLPLCHIF